MDSEDNSDSSTAPSPSPPASPAPALHTLPSAERLIQYFVAAKRALSSTESVWRANELVASSRNLVEEIAILNGRNSFSQRVVNEQTATLRSIRDGIAGAGGDAGDEFQETINKLDRANDRLERSLNVLKKTVVEASLQRQADPIEDETTSNPDLTDDKTLYDFIDETNHTELQSSLRTLIDSYNDSRADLDSSIHSFDSSLTTIADILSGANNIPDPPEISAIHNDEPTPTISHLFHSIEDHATEMAKLLESLVSHYDLCVTALKHTEGGGEAAKKAMQQNGGGDPLAKTPTNGVEESLYLKSVPEPISIEERSEMLSVLETDAQVVDDVVNEIRDRNRDQENQFEMLSRKAEDYRSKNRNIKQVLEMLHEIKDIHLPSHLHALSTFKSSWKRIHASIESQTAELASLSTFYDGFRSGYDRLLREVERRRAADAQMRKVADKARRDLGRLAEADDGLRAEFMEETGKFLPHGIWPGLMEQRVKWEVREVGGEED